MNAMTASQVLALAGEGVPLAVIARSFKLPSGEIYELVREAVDQGRVPTLPAFDWPPGSKDRVPAFTSGAMRPLVRAHNVDGDPLIIPLRQMLGFTRQEAQVYCAILRGVAGLEALHRAAQINGRVPADGNKLVKVVVVKIRRKLLEAGEAEITPQTLVGDGYVIERPVADAVIARVQKFEADNAR